MNGYTPFSEIYNSFLSKITDDMFYELSEVDTYRMLEDLLISAIPKFEFPKKPLDFRVTEVEDVTTYSGVENDYKFSEAILYNGGYFTCKLDYEEINILSTYMIVEWLGQQLASIENTRMKYSGSDFKFTSQANHMSKILQMKTDYEREGFHLQRLYKRRRVDDYGRVVSTMDIIMAPLEYPRGPHSGSRGRRRW